MAVPSLAAVAFQPSPALPPRRVTPPLRRHRGAVAALTTATSRPGPCEEKLIDAPDDQKTQEDVPDYEKPPRLWKTTNSYQPATFTASPGAQLPRSPVSPRCFLPRAPPASESGLPPLPPPQLDQFSNNARSRSIHHSSRRQFEGLAPPAASCWPGHACPRTSSRSLLRSHLRSPSHETDPEPVAVDPPPACLPISEQKAKDVLLYHYKHAAKRFSAKLTPADPRVPECCDEHLSPPMLPSLGHVLIVAATIEQEEFVAGQVCLEKQRIARHEQL
ncbi:proline-rich receptor-like protein kinase PERK13 [Panicum virgatum]|uniref:proline-rich receptor-like protein kinase PERK13 n=1 Tax=Panicum virgatum TaxID=38727 RepID=UPI0019D57D25|nr:proline-rich receptor-like protein kinase PERK13 [Panicum virgatum]